MDMICDKIQPYVRTVLDHDFGLKKRRAHLVEVYGTENEDIVINSLSLDLPYGSRFIRWDFTFNVENLYTPPEIFSDDGFFEAVPPELIKQHVPSLAIWEPNNVGCFLQLLLELMHVFFIMQERTIAQIENFKFFRFQFETFSVGLETSDFEVTLHNDSRGPFMEVVIALHLNLDGLPGLHDPSASLVLLDVTYKNFGDAVVTVDESSDLENLIGSYKCPNLGVEDHLVDYVPKIRNHLQSKVDTVKSSLRCRKNLVEALTSFLTPALTSVDSDLYTKVSFLLENVQKAVVCIVDLADVFPEKGVRLSTITIGKSPNAFPLHHFHYDAKWDVDTAAKKIIQAFARDVFVGNFSQD